MKFTHFSLHMKYTDSSPFVMRLKYLNHWERTRQKPERESNVYEYINAEHKHSGEYTEWTIN